MEYGVLPLSIQPIHPPPSECLSPLPSLLYMRGAFVIVLVHVRYDLDILIV